MFAFVLISPGTVRYLCMCLSLYMKSEHSTL